jgi:hypothetical protein
LDLDDDEFVGDNFSAQEYPLLTRFAIIATYCASYNPQTTDQRFFFKVYINNTLKYVKYL